MQAEGGVNYDILSYIVIIRRMRVMPTGHTALPVFDRTTAPQRKLLMTFVPQEPITEKYHWMAPVIEAIFFLEATLKS